jgi:hypothetical protein
VKTSRGVFEETSNSKRRTTLLRRIRKFREVQVDLIPTIRSHVDVVDGDVSIEPEIMPLLLPSDVYFDDKDCSAIFSSDILYIEAQLREAQASDALAELRNKLRARGVAAQYKTKMPKSQGMFTRQRTLEDQIRRKIQVASETYTTARNCLLRLKVPGDWSNSLKELRPEDIRGINERLMLEEEKEVFRLAQRHAGVDPKETEQFLDGEYGAPPTVTITPLLARGEGKRPPISWIWYSVTLTGMSDDEVAEREGSSTEDIEASEYLRSKLEHG